MSTHGERRTAWSLLVHTGSGWTREPAGLHQPAGLSTGGSTAQCLLWAPEADPMRALP